MLGCEEVMRLVKHIETDPAPRGRLQPKTETRAAPEADPAPSAERRLQPIPQALRSPEFMERAMNAHGASVYRLALNQTRSPHDAEDVSQDVFLRLLRDKTDFVDDGHLKAWLLRVTINRCLEVRRSAWRRRAVIGTDEEWATLEAVADGDPTDDPEARALAALAKSPVWKAMQQLPEAWRLAVHLHHVEGYSTEEIAQLTHCKAATVRTRLHRARKKLRDALANAEKADSAREPACQGQARISASRPSTKREGVGGMHAAPSKTVYRATKEVASDEKPTEPAWNAG